MISRRTGTEAAVLLLAGALAGWACMPGGLDGGPADAQDEEAAVSWDVRTGTCADGTSDDDGFTLFTVQDADSVVHLSVLVSPEGNAAFNTTGANQLALQSDGRVGYNTCAVLDASARWRVLIGTN